MRSVFACWNELPRCVVERAERNEIGDVAGEELGKSRLGHLSELLGDFDGSRGVFVRLGVPPQFCCDLAEY